MTAAVFLISVVVPASPALFRKRDSAPRIAINSRASGIS
jgi:hypothetical protein